MCVSYVLKRSQDILYCDDEIYNQSLFTACRVVVSPPNH